MTRIKAPVEDLRVGDMIELRVRWFADDVARRCEVHTIETNQKRRIVELGLRVFDTAGTLDVTDAFGFGCSLTQLIEVPS
jgi:hypothetical protein